MCFQLLPHEREGRWPTVELWVAARSAGGVGETGIGEGCTELPVTKNIPWVKVYVETSGEGGRSYSR